MTLVTSAETAMSTDQLARLLLQHPGLPVVMCFPTTIEPVWGIDLDCFTPSEGLVVVLIGEDDG